jgi:hypothetical protein
VRGEWGCSRDAVTSPQLNDIDTFHYNCYLGASASGQQTELCVWVWVDLYSISATVTYVFPIFLFFWKIWSFHVRINPLKSFKNHHRRGWTETDISETCCTSIFRVWLYGIYICEKPHGLKHELSSPAWTLGCWVRIQLDAWMSVCVYSVCVVLCVGRDPTTGWSPVQGVVPTM